MRFAITAAALAAACFAVPAAAADFSISFTATNFRQAYPAFLNVPDPVNPVTFTGLLHLDLTANVDPTTTGLTVQSFNLPYGVQYAYNSNSDTLIFGTQIDGVNGNYSIQPQPSTWFIAIGGALRGTPIAFNFVQMVEQVQANSPYTYSTTDVTFSIVRLDVPVNSPVPEPTTWAMMLLGFGAIGGALRQRKATSPSLNALAPAGR